MSGGTRKAGAGKRSHRSHQDWGRALVDRLIEQGRLQPDALIYKAGGPGRTTPMPAANASQVLPEEAVVRGRHMNRTEERYLQRLRALGADPRFEALTLCVTLQAQRRIRYTPDFVVLGVERIELHEVKGGFVREDARLKFHFAVEQWGAFFDFIWAQYIRGEWVQRRFAHSSGLEGTR